MRTTALVAHLVSLPRCACHGDRAAFGGPRTGASTARRHILAELQGFVCARCGDELQEMGCDESHIIPKCGDNGYIAGNIAILCRSCNMRMSNGDYSERIINWARADVIVTEWPATFPRAYRAEFPKSASDLIND